MVKSWTIHITNNSVNQIILKGKKRNSNCFGKLGSGLIIIITIITRHMEQRNIAMWLEFKVRWWEHWLLLVIAFLSNGKIRVSFFNQETNQPAESNLNRQITIFPWILGCPLAKWKALTFPHKTLLLALHGSQNLAFTSVRCVLLHGTADKNSLYLDSTAPKMLSGAET